MAKFREVRDYPETVKQFLDQELPGWDDMPDERFHGGLQSLCLLRLTEISKHLTRSNLPLFTNP